MAIPICTAHSHLVCATLWAVLLTRRLTPADYRKMPWRNGGGTTTELAISPEGGGGLAERFLYRVSIADVAADGPFSRFEGYDRHIMLVAGAGMSLDCGHHGRIDLRAPFEPRRFSGDWDVHGALVGGSVRDFNLIVDRARATSELEVRLVSAPETIACGAGTTCIIHILEGHLDEAAEGDTIVSEAPLPLVPRDDASGRRVRVAIARVSRSSG